jgi:hypothetical protein
MFGATQVQPAFHLSSRVRMTPSQLQWSGTVRDGWGIVERRYLNTLPSGLDYRKLALARQTLPQNRRPTALEHVQ